MTSAPGESSTPRIATELPRVLTYETVARHSLGRSMLLVGWGIFVSTLTQTFPGLVADLPIRDILQEKVGTLKMATFFAVAMSPWYFKPIAGLLSDAFPIFGTRRKSYMILGAIAAGFLWLLLGAAPHTYRAMLTVAVCMNVALVVISSSTAGLLVEDGQRLGATGRLTSARMVVMSSAVVLGGLLGGWFAQHHLFKADSIFCAVLLFSLVPVVVFLLHEPKHARRDIGALENGWEQIKKLARCGTMWAAAGMLFLIKLSPGFQSPLYDHLTKDLMFSKQFIGVLQSAEGAAGVLAALIYAWACREFSLRTLLMIALAFAAAGVLPFLFLHSRPTGIVAYATLGFGEILAQLAALDLATRASPRGVEAMGYALMVSAYNISLNLSDVTGSWLWGHLHRHFGPLVAINAGTTLLVLLVVPFLPSVLVASREGERENAD
jgi:MFS family permease